MRVAISTFSAFFCFLVSGFFLPFLLFLEPPRLLPEVPGRDEED